MSDVLDRSFQELTLGEQQVYWRAQLLQNLQGVIDLPPTVAVANMVANCTMACLVGLEAPTEDERRAFGSLLRAAGALEWRANSPKLKGHFQERLGQAIKVLGGQ